MNKLISNHIRYMIKRTYVTFSEGDNYQDMCNILVEGISKLSKYDILVYSSSDFDEIWDIENWFRYYRLF